MFSIPCYLGEVQKLCIGSDDKAAIKPWILELITIGIALSSQLCTFTTFTDPRIEMFVTNPIGYEDNAQSSHDGALL